MQTAVDKDTIVNVDQRSTADGGLEKTTTSPQMQNADIQAMDEVVRQSLPIHFQNCGIVYLNSFNTHSIDMQGSANHVPQVTHNFPRNIDYEKTNNLLYSQSYRDPDFHGSTKDPPPRTFGIHRSYSINDVMFFSSAAFAAGSCAAFLFCAHRYETNRLRHIARFFGHLFATDSISWTVFEYVKINGDDTTTKSRIFIKIQEMMEEMTLKTLAERFKDPQSILYQPRCTQVDYGTTTSYGSRQTHHPQTDPSDSDSDSSSADSSDSSSEDDGDSGASRRRRSTSRPRRLGQDL
ncbi:hypothetical protein BYT27DRAFT_7252280 [Phlegmacium glaucopus]|nr:hypothetical protein BYT27DRAFT_7252280 [Phlegmacium glaucopus]